MANPLQAPSRIQVNISWLCKDVEVTNKSVTFLFRSKLKIKHDSRVLNLNREVPQHVASSQPQGRTGPINVISNFTHSKLLKVKRYIVHSG